MNMGFDCTMKYHHIAPITRYKNQLWLAYIHTICITFWMHFRSRVCKIETRQSHLTNSGNVRDKSWQFEEYIIKNMFMSRFENPDLLFYTPCTCTDRDCKSLACFFPMQTLGRTCGMSMVVLWPYCPMQTIYLWSTLWNPYGNCWKKIHSGNNDRCLWIFIYTSIHSLFNIMQ